MNDIKTSFCATKKLLQKANTLVREAELQSIFSVVAGGLGDVYLLLGRPDDALPNFSKLSIYTVLWE